MWALYYAGMYCFVLGLRLASPFHQKASQWIQGRRKWKEDLPSIPRKQNTRIWFHVSSLGEFEQARPVIEQLKARAAEIEIILTFFSPSGYLIRKDYHHAFAVMYLPADLPGYADYWLQCIDPDYAIFVKYDLWPGYLRGLNKRSTPAILIAANFSDQKGISSAFNPLTRKFLPGLKVIFTQRDEHAVFPLLNLVHAGDPRIDRVMHLPVEAFGKVPEGLKLHKPFDIVAGSIWGKDEEILIPVINKLDLSAILVPHDVSRRNIDRMISRLKKPFMLLSDMKDDDVTGTKILIVDTIGILAYLYPFGKTAFIGGGFGKSIHNILEPMAHGRPVIFGPAFHSFPEATDGVREGFGFAVNNSLELEQRIASLLESDTYTRAGMLAKEYIEKMSGASAIITDYILNSIHSPTK